MPRGGNQSNDPPLFKGLIAGDGKCGKSDWLIRAAEGGFNVLYMNGDVAQQTVSAAENDPLKPMSREVLNRIFLINMHDTLEGGSLDHRMVDTFKRFCNQPTFRWNESQGREWAILKDGDETTDEVWEIRPGQLDHTCVLGVDSWTSLAQSAMNWAAEESGLDLMEVAERGKMRDVYQAAGEKLTQFLIMIRSVKCHVVVIAHPREYTKTERQPGKSAREAKEADAKVLWTKMVVASSSNNHAFGMAKFFSDLAWIEVDSMGKYMIDFRADINRISGSHINERLDTRAEGSFVNVIKRLGGVVPGAEQPFDHWLTIHQGGFKAPDGRKPGLVLGAQKPADGAPAQVTGIPSTTKAQPVRLNLGQK